MIYILKITVEAVLRMYCKGAEGNREPCKKVIPVIHGYSGAGEKQVGFLSFTYKLDLENLIQDRTNENLAYVTNKNCLKNTNFPGTDL